MAAASVSAASGSHLSPYFLLLRIFKIRFDAWNLRGFRQKKV
ncbi:CEP57 isoform 15 [Pan troglodytes]|uniref:Centrosomal protein 57 n=3 Tax=Hominidae TaxID=9604 RepID=F5H7J4_HUMAN|nr:CEP57 isoform 15 [Pan troglodytes]PNJ86452.1 CEP57 isoform 8 [Pongo abelii]